MATEYKCTKSFSVELYDGDGFPTEQYKDIDIGTTWYRDDEANIIGGEVHLENIGDLGWVEIPLETFEGCFEEVKECETNG